MFQGAVTQLFARMCRAKLSPAVLILLCCTTVQALTIDDGQSPINHTPVQLHLTLPTNCYQAQFQNEDNTPVLFTNPTDTMPWTLSEGDGQKTVKVIYSYYYIYNYQCGTYSCNPHCCSYNWLGQCTGTCYDSCPRYCQGQGTSTSTESAQITLDQTSPSLAISNPTDQSHTNTPTTIVSGAVSDLNGIRQLIVRGMPASIEAYNSSGVEVPLNAGANQITVIAMDNAGNSQVANRIVYFDPPQNGACGAANGQALTSAPVTDLCSVGTASTVNGSGPWNWSCAGVNGGTAADCAATLKTWTVTPSAGDNGSINPGSPQTVVHGSTTAFTVTPIEGYRIADVAGSCGGTLIGTTYTTNAVTADCTVEASFTRNLSTLTVNQAGAGTGTLSLSPAGASVTPHNGSLVNGPAWAAGKFGNGLSLANGQYVQVPDPAGDLNITGDLTIALWVNPNSVTCSGADPAYALLSKRSANHATPYELFIGCGGTLTLHSWATNTRWPNFTATGTVTAGAWQHLAVTRSYAGSNATVTFYIDGVAAGSSTLDTGPALGSSDPLWISRDGYHTTNTSQGSYSGLMDDVQIYNRALSAAEIGRIYANDYAPPANRIGNWKLDETAGTTASDSTQLTCTGSCSESYGSGAVVGLTATPAAGSVFTGWSGDGDCSDGSVTVAADTTCTATFSPASYLLTVGKTGTGTGTVTSSPAAITCGGTCTASLAPETTVTLTATADSGSAFTGWSGDPDCADGVVTMAAARNCTAAFDTYAFAVAPPSHDFGTKDVGDPIISSITLTITNGRNSYRRIQSISLAGANAGDFTIPMDSCSQVDYAPTGWCMQSVYFTPQSAGAKQALLRITTDDPATPVIDVPLSGTGTLKQYTLAITNSGTGVGTVTSTPACIACISGSSADCSASMNQGTAITLTATPSNISVFGGWSGDCSGSGECTFTLTGNKSVDARFELADKARISGTGYPSFEAAYSDAGAAAVILLLDDLLPISWAIDKPLALHGGYNCSFDSQVGYTTLDGILTVRRGSVEADRLIVK